MACSREHKEGLAFQLFRTSMIPWKHVFLGLLIRELLAPFTGHQYDFEIWARLGVYMQSLQNPYTGLPYYPGISFAPTPLTGSISYPPLSAFIFALTYRLYLALGEPSRFLYYFLLKQPIVLSDVAVAIVLFRIITISKSPDLGRTGLLIWLYFPFGILVSSVWGALDPIALLLTLLAVYYFVTSKQVASASLLGLAIFLKPIPLVALPVLLMQLGTGLNRKLRYAVISLVIPAVGTLAPVLLLNWGFVGIFRNFSFQVAIPSYGALSILRVLSLLPSIPGAVHFLIGVFWIPALLIAYVYILQRKLPLLQGLMVVFSVFSISRPFLSEQWAIYPLALLLTMLSKPSLQHFIGLATSATGFLIANNTLLVSFLSPLSVVFYNWNVYVDNLSPYVLARTVALSIFASLYFAETLLTLLGKRSLVYKALIGASTRLRVQLPTTVRTSLETKPV